MQTILWGQGHNELDGLDFFLEIVRLVSDMPGGCGERAVKSDGSFFEVSHTPDHKMQSLVAARAHPATFLGTY